MKYVKLTCFFCYTLANGRICTGKNKSKHDVKLSQHTTQTSKRRKGKIEKMKTIFYFAAIVAICIIVFSSCDSADKVIRSEVKATNSLCPLAMGNGLIMTSVYYDEKNVTFNIQSYDSIHPFNQGLVTNTMKRKFINELKEKSNEDENFNRFINALEELNVRIIYHYYTSDSKMDVIIGPFEFQSETEPLSVVPIDLGLPSGILWAKYNLGASSCEEPGDYFFWGDTKPCENGSRYKYVNEFYYEGGGESQYLKYVTDKDEGIVDGKTTLDLSDDAASVMLGELWSIPTVSDIEELLKYCIWKETEKNGIDGIEFTGPNGNSLFFPSFDGCYAPSYNLLLGFTSYWTQSLSSNDRLAMALQIKQTSNGTEVELDWEYRTSGCFIRPVKH